MLAPLRRRCTDYYYHNNKPFLGRFFRTSQDRWLRDEIASMNTIKATIMITTPSFPGARKTTTVTAAAMNFPFGMFVTLPLPRTGWKAFHRVTYVPCDDLPKVLLDLSKRGWRWWRWREWLRDRLLSAGVSMVIFIVLDANNFVSSGCHDAVQIGSPFCCCSSCY